MSLAKPVAWRAIMPKKIRDAAVLTDADKVQIRRAFKRTKHSLFIEQVLDMGNEPITAREAFGPRRALYGQEEINKVCHKKRLPFLYTTVGLWGRRADRKLAIVRRTVPGRQQKLSLEIRPRKGRSP